MSINCIGGAQAHIDNAWMRMSPYLGGFCTDVIFYPKYGQFWIVKHKEDGAYKLIMAPSAEWKGDIEADGYEIVHDLTAEAREGE